MCTSTFTNCCRDGPCFCVHRPSRIVVEMSHFSVYIDLHELFLYNNSWRSMYTETWLISTTIREGRCTQKHGSSLQQFVKVDVHRNMAHLYNNSWRSMYTEKWLILQQFVKVDVHRTMFLCTSTFTNCCRDEPCFCVHRPSRIILQQFVKVDVHRNMDHPTTIREGRCTQKHGSSLQQFVKVDVHRNMAHPTTIILQQFVKVDVHRNMAHSTTIREGRCTQKHRSSYNNSWRSMYTETRHLHELL
jgi:hypothetical protein